jgi:EAL domain-containing protein (putative c-di-GMP-specific phosphodiesterase class I)
LIESTELIKPLTMYLVRRSLEDMALMAAAGFSLRVAVNLPPSCLLDLRFAGELVEALHEAGLDSSALELEFTERAVHENPTRVRQVLDSLADAGFDIAVDDFGAGQAPIVYLTQLPISSLKIDPEFARDVHQRTASAAVVSFTVALARSLHLRVVAEGVETIEAFRSLVQMGCDEIQGYLVARPLRPDDLVEFMRGVEAHGVRLALDTSDAIVRDEPNDVEARTSSRVETA